MRGGNFLWIILGVMALGLVFLLASGDSGSVFGMEDEAFARTLYLGVLAAVVSVGVLGSGIRFGQAARTMAIWAAIILVLMAGYQYRYELQDIASRVTAGLVPGSPLSITDEDGRAAVMLDRMASGHFEVRAEVNGTPVTVMVDTGATGTVLTAADARRAGYDPDTLSFDVPIMTANGQARAARIVAEELRVGDIVRTRLPLLVVPEGQLDRSLLGMNFIGTLSGFDMRGERLILRD